MTVCSACGRESGADARFCAGCGAELAPQTAAREERKIVSVVFVDLVGHTAHSDSSDPEDVRARLQPYYVRVRDELERYGGTVEKFIGDAVVAVFGAPTSHEDDPERAVRAALAVCEALVEDGLDGRVAVNTGEALVALDARTGEGEALVAGDVVNTASRMQSAAPVNGVLVGEGTHRATDRIIEYADAPSIAAKGKSEPVRVWRAIRPRARLGVDVDQHGSAALAGRDVELRLLRDAFERAGRERATQLVTVVGVPGIGKSRLVWELLRHIHALPYLVYWRQGRALAYGGGAFGAVGEAVRAHIGVLESDGPPEIEAKVAAALEALFSDERDRSWLAGRVRPLVGLGGEAAGGREESFAAWQRLIETIADRVPLVLVLEDLHWADDGTLDFVEHLVDWTSDVPLLVLCTSRPELLERRPSWGGGRLNSLTVALSPLSDEATAELLGELLGRPALDADVQARLLQQAGGNPLYAEEYARMLGAAASAELPDSVQGIIAARLDLLDPPEKQLLQNAAVLGKVFWRGGVGALGTDASDELVQRLIRKEFLRRERGSSIAGEQELAFRHALVRDVAYAQLPRAARAEKHRLAAEWIAATSTSRPDLVAHHYLQALELAGAAGGDTATLAPPARAALRAAGDRATSLGAYHDATELYRRALDLDPDDDERRGLLGAVVETASASLDPDAKRWAEAAVAACEAAGDLAGAADAETALSTMAWYAGDADEDVRHGERAVELAERGGSGSSLARALAARARHLMLADHHEEAIELGGRAIELAGAAGLEDIAVDALVTVGTARGNLGDDEAFEILGDALERARAANAPVPMFRALNNTGYLVRRRYGLAAAAPISDEMESEVLRRYGMLSTLRWFDSAISWNAYQGGDWDESLRRAESFWRRSNQPHRLDVEVLISTASIAAGRGDDRTAWADLERAVTRVRATANPQALAQTLVHATRLASLTGRHDDEQRFFEELEGLGWAALSFAAEATTEIAWLAVDFGRRFELAPSRSVWREAYDAIVDGRLGEATGVLDAIGVATEAAYVRLRRARIEPGPWLDEAEAFYTDVRATRFLREVAELRAAATRRSA